MLSKQNFNEINQDLRRNRQIEMTTFLGKGAFGAVYAARSITGGGNTDPCYAVKIVPANGITEETQLNQWKESERREVEFLSKLRHPNIVTYHGHEWLSLSLSGGSSGDQVALAIITELLWKDLKSDLVGRNAPCLLQDIIQMIRQIGSALVYMHANGTVHHDLKAENIMLTFAGDGGWVAKLIDLGLAKYHGSKQLEFYYRAGSPAFRSPEKQNKTMWYNPFKADSFAFGLVLMQMRLGSALFEQVIDRCTTENIHSFWKQELALNLTDFDDELISKLIYKLICPESDGRCYVYEIVKVIELLYD